MSRNEWERGIITLPASEFAKVRQAVQQGETAHKEQVFELSQEFWKGLNRKQQTDPGEYLKAGQQFIAAKDRERIRAFVPGRNTETDKTRDKLLDDLSEALELDGYARRPARVLKTDMDFPTNRTTDFNAGYGEVIFDKKTNQVEWIVEENNNAVEHAHAHPVANAFFDAVSKVRWTRGTGGVFTGNDEYRREASYEGGASNYVTTAFGPVGADEAPDNCRPFIDSKGKATTQKDLDAAGRAKTLAMFEAQRKAQEAYAKSVKASAAQPRGHNGHAGQYTYRSHGEPTFRL